MAVLEDNVSYLKISSFLDIWHKNVLLFYYIARVPKWITLCPGVWQIFWRVLKESVCVRICWKKNKRNFLYIKLKQDYVGNMSLLIVYKNEIRTLPNTISSVQFSHSVVSDSLQPHESQHTRPPCPSPSPRVHSDSRPLSRWCHSAISSTVIPFCSCPQSLPVSESFPMSQLFAWGGQSTGISVLASFLPKKSQGWSPSEWTGWIPLQSKGLSRVFSNTTVQEHQFFGAQPSSQSNSHIHTWLLEKLLLCLYRPLLAKWCLCFLLH